MLHLIIFNLKGEKEKIIRQSTKQKYNRYITIKEKEAINAFTNDEFTRKASIEDHNKNTMVAVYDKVF